MITELRMENFFSFGAKTKISFQNDKENKLGYYKYYSTKTVKASASLLNGFFGENSSGKTTVLKALTLILESIFSTNQYNFTQFYPSYHKKYFYKKTHLGIDFLLNNKIYSYDIKIQTGDIEVEVLKVTDLNAKSPRASIIFTRGKNPKDTKFGKKYNKLKGVIEDSEINQYQTILSYLTDGRSALLKDILELRDKYFSNVVALNNYRAQTSILDQTVRTLENNPEALNITMKIIQLFDQDIEEIIIEKSEKILTPSINLSVKHKSFVLPVRFINESSGTKEFFTWAFKILNSLQNGGILIFDDLNRCFHPEIQKEVYKLFLDANINKNHAQIFFTSHDFESMNYLSSDQIHIVEKKSSTSKVFKLSEIVDLKSRDNFEKKYRLGLYGGMPDLTDFNNKIKDLL